MTEKEEAELLRVLGAIGDNSSLIFLRQALKKTASPVYEAAVRALSEWPDVTPIDDLLEVAGTAENTNHRILALRAYIQKIGDLTFRLPAAALDSLKKGLALAERPEEKRMVLALLPQYSDPEALALARSLLSDDRVAAEAGLAVQKILYGYIKTKWIFF